MAYELIDVTTDPLYILMMREGDDTDELEESYMAGTHRAKSWEAERMTSDMLGASPFELDAVNMLD